MGAEPFEQLVPWQGSVEASFEAAQQSLVEEHGAAIDDLDDDDGFFVLTVLGVSNKPADQLAAPLPEPIVRQVFGTDKPTMATFDERVEGLDEIDDELYGRGRCYYLVIYEDEQPNQVYFWGWTLD